MARTDLQGRDELAQSDNQEVEVEEELELLVEDDGEEGEQVVLLVPHDVWGELGLELLYELC